MKTKLIMRMTVACVAVLIASAGQVRAGVMTHPPGLNPGDVYHLAFLTAGSRDATSSNINDYNQFVQEQADAGSLTSGLDLEWKAIASTQTVSAIDNAPVVGAVFLLDFTRVANSSGDLWDGAIQSPIDFTQNGITLGTTAVWTGTDVDGTSAESGFRALGTSRVRYGLSSNTNGYWIVRGAQFDLNTKSSFYALSEAITVNAVPEPASLAIFGMIGLLACGRRRKS